MTLFPRFGAGLPTPPLPRPKVSGISPRSSETCGPRSAGSGDPRTTRAWERATHCLSKSVVLPTPSQTRY
jgi:hypothetical protein